MTSINNKLFKHVCSKIILVSVAFLIMCTPFFVMPTKASTYYEDVSFEHWARPSVYHCRDAGLMLGTSRTHFSPGSTMTVAEAITVAVRLSPMVPDSALKAIPGGNWYDSAVAAAKKYGIIQENQFESYTRPVFRAEFAYLLAHAMPETSYKAINDVTSLPDVDYATIYNKEIYKLYNAGVLTGSDNRGTFYPYNNLTRAEAASMLSRAYDENRRKKFQFCSQPYGDLTVVTTDYRVNIGGIYSSGVVSIGGKLYISPASLKPYYENSEIEFYYNSNEYYSFSLYKNRTRDSSVVYDTYFIQPAGMVLGVAEVSSLPLCYNDKDYYGAVCTLGSKYVYFSLEALGAKQVGSEFVIPIDFSISGVQTVEEDFVGYALPDLRRDNVKNTALAIHDYIVNTLTYDPLVAPAPGTSQATLESVMATQQAAREKYVFDSNVTIASRNGVCQDYAELFNNMCNRMGIPCVMVTGGAVGLGGYGSHAWNRAYIDGAWYFIDTTHDDPVSSKPVLSHSYFMVSADKLANTHVWAGNDYPLPDDYDSSWEQIDPMNVKTPNEFRKCLVAQLAQGKRNIRIKGAYGGLACIYAYPTYFASFSGGYNSSTKSYEYTVQYFGD